jgi:hypothetical protein
MVSVCAEATLAMRERAVAATASLLQVLRIDVLLKSLMSKPIGRC